MPSKGVFVISCEWVKNLQNPNPKSYKTEDSIQDWSLPQSSHSPIQTLTAELNQKPRKAQQKNHSHGPGDGIHGRIDRRLGAGAPIPPLLRGHHTRQLPPAVRAGPTSQAHLRGCFRGHTLLSLVWLLFQSPFYSANVTRLCFHALLPKTLRDHYLCFGLRLPHRLVRMNKKKTNLWFRFVNLMNWVVGFCGMNWWVEFFCVLWRNVRLDKLV